MRLGYHWNVRPFEIADDAGLNTFVRIGELMRVSAEDQPVAKSDLIQRMIEK
jgi:3-hydroxyacyl-CoA dehydrogenase